MTYQQELRKGFIQFAIGVSISVAIFTLLLFFTSVGDGIPVEIKIGMPIVAWVAGMVYFASNRKKYFPRQ